MIDDMQKPRILTGAKGHLVVPAMWQARAKRRAVLKISTAQEASDPMHRHKFKSPVIASCVLAFVSACSEAAAPGGSPGTAGFGATSAGSSGVPAAGAGGTGQGQAGAAGGASAGAPTAGAPAHAGATSDGGTSSGLGGSTSGGAAGAGTAGAGTAGAGTAGAGTAGAGTAGAGGAPAVSCPAKVLAAGNTNRTLQAGGKSRSYVLHVPSAYKGTAPVPLIVDFHGHGGTGVGQATDSPYPKVVDGDGVLMVFPTAIGDWNMGPCCADDVDDIGFAKALVTEVEGLGCVDPKRVYATGFSMGGAMSHQLACQAADVFAAVAPAAFDLLEEHLATCKPKRPITVITFRGTQDTLAIYAGGLSNLVRPIHFLGAISSMKKWAELDGCTGQAMDLGNNCQGFAAAQCPGGVESIVCSKTGGGHEQGNATLGWPVLKRHQLP